jgi:hypothetical protein
MLVIGRGVEIFQDAFRKHNITIPVIDSGIDTRTKDAPQKIVQAINEYLGKVDLILFARHELVVEELETFDHPDVCRIVVTNSENTVFWNCVHDLVEEANVDRYVGMSSHTTLDAANAIVRFFELDRNR